MGRSTHRQAPSLPSAPAAMSCGHSCGLRADGTVECWGRDSRGQATPPSGRFTSVSAGTLHTCGLRRRRRHRLLGRQRRRSDQRARGSVRVRSVPAAGTPVACGPMAPESAGAHNPDGRTSVPSGAFTSISAGFVHSCGVRPDGSVDLLGIQRPRPIQPPAWKLHRRHGRRLARPADSAPMAPLCAGDEVPTPSPPRRRLPTHPSALRTTTVAESESTVPSSAGRAPPSTARMSNPPSGSTHVGVMRQLPSPVAGRADLNLPSGFTRLANDPAQSPVVFPPDMNPPSGTFSVVSASGWGQGYACGVRTNGAVECWGDALGELRRLRPAHSRQSGRAGTTPVAFAPMVPSSAGATATTERPSRRPAASPRWASATTTPAGCERMEPSPAGDRRPTAGPSLPSGTFTSLSAGFGHTCGLRTDGSVACWGLNDQGESSPPPGVFASVTVGDNFSCGLRPNGAAECWGYNDGRTTPPA